MSVRISFREKLEATSVFVRARLAKMPMISSRVIVLEFLLFAGSAIESLRSRQLEIARRGQGPFSF